MAKRKRGQDVHGWVLIDKPAGIGSTEVVSKVQRAFDAKKAGHGGTLDPDATGLLPIALGDATKFLPFLENKNKTYIFAVNWGSETTTDDASGEVICASAIRPSLAQINQALPKFRGQISQVPPQVSAVKYMGERAYDLARAGIKMELKARDLFVESLELTSADLSGQSEQCQFVLSCGKGGYVRSIARDLGREIGCLGHVAWLRRINTLGFSVLDAQHLDQDFQLIPITKTADFIHLEINKEEADALAHGQKIPFSISDGQYLAICQGEPIAIVKAAKNLLQVLRGLSYFKKMP